MTHHPVSARRSDRAGRRSFRRAGISVLLGLVVGLLAAVSPAATGPAAASEGPYVVPPSGSWTVNGAGWGHGIGMSQWGAQGAALQGRSFSEIVGFYYPGTVLGYVANPGIRVQLTKYYSTDYGLFGAIGGESLTARDMASGESQVLPAATRYLVQIDATGMYLAYRTTAGTWSPITFNGRSSVAGPIEVVGASGASVYNANDSGVGTQYRGALRFVRTGANGVQPVNSLSLDEYLKGVVPRESPSSWHIEALRAQSLAARSYALAVSSPGASWDICDTDQCQVYGGRASIAANGAVTSLEAASTNSAVDTTSGIVVAYGNAVAFTQFSSSNGGYSVAGSKPYLVAQPDPYSGSAPNDPVSRWTTQLPASRLQAYCPSGGSLRSFEITGRDGRGPFGGRITSVRVNCSTGSSTVTGASALAFGMLHRMWAPAAPPGSNPTGTVERLAPVGNAVQVSGWALDPDSTASIEVHVYINGGGYNLGPADLSRPDVAAAFPGYGDRHGFQAELPLSPGDNQVCVYGINVGPGANSLLTCQTVRNDGSPIGRTELASVGAGPASIRMVGWALDPDTVNPIEVHAYIDGGGHNLGPADDPRPDVGAAYKGYGDAHGFDATVYAAPGSHQVCLWAINVGGGSNKSLGCSTVNVSGDPIGNLEQATSSGSTITVGGWAFDPDTAAPIEIHVYVDGGGFNTGPTSLARPDVAQAYSGFGERSGFTWSVNARPGTHQVCVYAINVGVGSHRLLGCRAIATS